jgi:hypothetical protein
MNYTAILKIKTTLADAAQECLALFNEGARLDASFAEETFALYNTPLQDGYCRVVVAEHIAAALQWLKDTEAVSENVEIVRVEWAGQDKVSGSFPLLDEEGNPTGETEEGYVEELFQTGTQDITDEAGDVVAIIPVYLGRII